jgi:hypothetical protein
MSLPDFDWFGDDVEPVTEVVMDDAPQEPINVDLNSIETELDEMERLTGARMAIDAEESTMPSEPVQEVIAMEPEPVEPMTVPSPPEVDQANNFQMKDEVKMAEPETSLETADAPASKTNENMNDVAMKDSPDSVALTDAGCPAIILVPATKSMTKFDADNPSVMAARASITEVRGGCEFVDGGMEIDLDILMRGTITNAGRFEGNRNQEAFISFPYYVTVLNPQGTPVNKEIMATAMRFRPNVDFLDHAEKITQFVPMPDPSVSKAYSLSVGFQLNRKQLEYNKALNEARPDNTRVSPDTSLPLRRSVNPLANE